MRFFIASLLLLLMVFNNANAKSQNDPDFGPNLLKDNKALKIYQENEKGIPNFIDGKIVEKVAKGTEVDVIHSFFEENKGAFRINNPAEELKVRQIALDDIGMRHLRFEQYYNNLRVIGGDLSVHFTGDDILKTINGNYIPDIKIETSPVLSLPEAEQIAIDDLKEISDEGKIKQQELVIFPWEGEVYLCWRMFIFSDTPMGRWEYFIDAKNSDIVFKANRIMDAEEIGTGTGVMGNVYNHLDTYYNGSTFEMSDYTRQAANNIHDHDGQMPAGNYIRTNIAGSSLPGTLATDSDNIWNSSTQAPAVDGHMYSALFYDWLLRETGRNGYDDNGASMLTVVNYSGEGDNNAYWDGSRIVVWSWSTGWRSLAGCPDVIAHEWGHAVTETTSNLVYQKEPGALNESFSDMIGAAFEFAHDTLDVPDWYMGENGLISGNGFRSMSDPHEFSDPDYYGTTDPYWVDVDGCSPSYYNDYCGVHTNSGVGNKWFFLLSDGGTHHSVTVTGIGVENAFLIAYRANAYYWNSQTDYHEAALGTISAAHDLDPSGAWELQVAQAWNAVGVSTPSPSLAFDYPNGLPETTIPGQATTFEVVVSGTLGGVPVSNTGLIYVSVNGRTFRSDPMVEISTNHYEATLPALVCGDVVEFYISAEMDPAIEVFDHSPTSPYSAVAATGQVTVFEDNFETDMGWTISGGTWARGVPTGGGGSYGYPDPTTGVVGANVYGYNLSGDYTNNMPERHLTSPVIDCTNLSKVHLVFWRWLGVEQPSYDHAYVRISTNGSTWTTIWENTAEVADNAWTEMDLDISAYADNQSTVYVRWTMGSTDGGWTYCGWNIDDVRIIGNECVTASNLTILTETLPEWTIGVTYSQQLEAINGTGTLTWSDKDSDLTGTGLTLSTSGLLEGTVSSAQNIAFTALVTDEDSATDEQLLSVIINPEIQIQTATLPDWTAGYAYAQQLTATGGTGTVSFSDKFDDLAGSGLTINPTGQLSGIPVEGTVSFTLEVSDAVGALAELPYTFTINPQIIIENISMPDWTAGVSLSQQFNTTGGTGSLSFTDKNNNLTGTGLNLTESGLLSGVPVSGAVSFILEVTDNIGATSELPVDFYINPELSIDDISVTAWTQGQPYSEQLVVNGGTGLKAWVDKYGDLSGTGVSLSATGALSGTFTSSSLISFTVEVSDEVGAVVDKVIEVNVNSPVAIITTSLPDGQQDEAYSVQLEASGGTGALTFIDYNGGLAETGLTLSSSGDISGIPTVTGTIDIMVSVNDLTGSIDQHLYNIYFAPAYICGDADGSGSEIDITDLVYLVAYMFGNPAGPEPPIMAAVDVNGSGDVDITDLVYLVDYMFGDPSGPAPHCGL